MEEYLYVFDYCLCEINEIKLSDNASINLNDEYDIEDLLGQYGLRASQCSWMFSYKQLSIERINKLN